MASEPDGEDGPTYTGTAQDMAPPGYDQVERAHETAAGVSTSISPVSSVAPVNPAAKALPFGKGAVLQGSAGGARPLPAAPR